jgi:hypothetical protein
MTKFDICICRSGPLGIYDQAVIEESKIVLICGLQIESHMISEAVDLVSRFCLSLGPEVNRPGPGMVSFHGCLADRHCEIRMGGCSDDALPAATWPY